MHAHLAWCTFRDSPFHACLIRDWQPTKPRRVSLFNLIPNTTLRNYTSQYLTPEPNAKTKNWHPRERLW